MILKRIIFAFLVMFHAQASLFKLADVLVNQSLLKEKIANGGVRGASLTELKRSVNTAVDSIQDGNQTFYDSLKSLRVNSEDLAKKKNLLNILAKNQESVSNNDFINAINDLFLLSQKYGNGVISCSVCNADDLKLMNINTSIKKIANPSIKKELYRVPKNGIRLKRFIKSKLTRLGLETNTSRLKPEDNRAFGLFLTLAENGSKDYKEFANAVIAFNKIKKKKVDLVGSDSISSIWKIVVDNISNDDLKKLTEVLNKGSKLEPSNREKAFYDELFRLAGNDSNKVDKVRRIKANNCYFR